MPVKSMRILKFLQIFLFTIILILSCRSTELKKSEWLITKDSTLALKSDIKIVNDSLILFSIVCKRLKLNESAYFPSSKDFVVEIYTENNNLIWKSDLNMSYLQVITPIEPIHVGEEYTYKLEWDGILSNGKSLPSGKYKVKLILPARPLEYDITNELVW